MNSLKCPDSSVYLTYLYVRIQWNLFYIKFFHFKLSKSISCIYAIYWRRNLQNIQNFLLIFTVVWTTVRNSFSHVFCHNTHSPNCPISSHCAWNFLPKNLLNVSHPVNVIVSQSHIISSSFLTKTLPTMSPFSHFLQNLQVKS